MTRGLSHCIISNFLRVYMTPCLICTKPVDQSKWIQMAPLSAQRSSDIFTLSWYFPTNVPVPFAQATGSKTRFVCTVHVCESSQFEPFKFKFYRTRCVHLCTAKSAYWRKATSKKQNMSMALEVFFEDVLQNIVLKKYLQYVFKHCKNITWKTSTPHWRHVELAGVEPLSPNDPCDLCGYVSNTNIPKCGN